MSTTLLVLLAGLVLAGVVAWRFVAQGGGSRKLGSSAPRDAPRQALPAPRQPTLATLAVNDVVTHFDRDYLVEGCVRYTDDGERWCAARLTDGDQESWLYVWGDPVERAALLTAGDVHALPAPPPQDTLSWGGESHRLERWGRAETTVAGDAGGRHGYGCAYFEYLAPGGRVVVAEVWGEPTPAGDASSAAHTGDRVVRAGQEVREAEFDILPGDEVV